MLCPPLPLAFLPGEELQRGAHNVIFSQRREHNVVDLTAAEGSEYRKATLGITLDYIHFLVASADVFPDPGKLGCQKMNEAFAGYP